MNLLEIGTPIEPPKQPEPKIAKRIEWLCPKCKTYERGVTVKGIKKSYCPQCAREVTEERYARLR